MSSLFDDLKKASAPDTFTGTRCSLLSRLKDWDDSGAWREFFDRYGKLIHAVALKSGLGDAEAQDVVQETLLSVARHMPGFRYDKSKGSFRSWLFNQTRWRIADEFRKRNRQRTTPTPSTDDSRTDLDLDQFPDATVEKLQASWDAEWRENQVARALERVKTQVSERQFQMFMLFAVQGWAMAEITRTLRVNRAQVYMAKLRVTKLVRAELARMEAVEM